MNEDRKVGMNIIQGKERKHEVVIDLSKYNPEYVGKFVFHHPTLFERMRVGVLKSQLLSGTEGQVDVITDNIAHMAATLQIVVDDSPKWFDINYIFDYEVLDEVYNEYFNWYNSFRTASAQQGNSQDSE